MATYSSYTYNGISRNLQFSVSQWGYFDFFTEMFINMSSTSTFHTRLLSKSLNLIGCQGDKTVNFRETSKNVLLRNHQVVIFFIHVYNTCL